MNEEQSKYLKLNIKFNLIDSQRQRDMVAINSYMDLILNLFGDEIIWDKLHVTDKTSDMYKLTQIIKNVKNVTVQSTQDATRIVNDE